MAPKIIALMLFLGTAATGVSVYQMTTSATDADAVIDHQMGMLRDETPGVAWGDDPDDLTRRLASPEVQALRDLGGGPSQEARGLVESILAERSRQKAYRWKAIGSALVGLLLGASGVVLWRRRRTTAVL